MGQWSYRWSSIPPSVGTVTYTVTGTDANSCVNTDQVDVTVNPLANVELMEHLHCVLQIHRQIYSIN